MDAIEASDVPFASGDIAYHCDVYALPPPTQERAVGQDPPPKPALNDEQQEAYRRFMALLAACHLG